MSGPAGYLRLGPYELGDVGAVPGVSGRCLVTIKAKSKGKVDNKESDGKSDAVSTWKGASPCDLDIDISWNNRPGIEADSLNDASIEGILAVLSPRGPSPGQPWECAFNRANAHGVSQIVIEELDGPTDEPGTSLVKAKLKASSWAEPDKTAKGQGAAKTPEEADKTDPPTATAKKNPGDVDLPPGKPWSQKDVKQTPGVEP
jgi:hypothetical protein